MLDHARLTFKIHRFEILAAILGTVAVGVAAQVVRMHLQAVAVDPACWERWAGPPDETGACGPLVSRFLAVSQSEADLIMAAMAVVPFAVGLILGVPLVGRELEQRTASTAWALAGSRRRWFLARSLPVLALALVLLVPIAWLAAMLQWERSPWFEPNVGRFFDLGLHGPTTVARGVAAFGLGVLAGAVLGRTLPAFLVGAAVSLALAGFVTPIARVPWFESKVEVIQEGGYIGDPPDGGIISAQLLRAADGRLLEYEEAEAMIPPGQDHEWLSQNFTPVDLGVRGTAYSEIEHLETYAWASLGGVLLLLVFPVLERRRPG